MVHNKISSGPRPAQLVSLAPIGSSCCRSGEVKNDVKPAIEGTRVDLLAHRTSDPREKDEADVRGEW